MGPKKKGKGSKLSRMTEEERARYLQHRAAIEEETRRRKQQLIATFMKNKLRHEEAFTRLNLAKLNQQWRQILRDIKCKELKQDLQAFWQTFDYAVDHKNMIIQNLLRDLDDAEEQYVRMFQSHAENIDDMLKFHGVRLGEINSQYERERRFLINYHTIEKEKICFQANSEEGYLRTIIFALNDRLKQFKERKGAQNKEITDELRDSMQFYCEKLQVEKESAIENLWLEFQTVLKGYASATEGRKMYYTKLKAQDAESCNFVSESFEKIASLSEYIHQLKSQLSTLKSNKLQRIQQLTIERDTFSRQFLEIRKVLNKSVSQDQKKITVLTVASNKTITKLKSLLSQTEKILTLHQICKKMQSEREKLQPIVDESLDAQDDDEEMRRIFTGLPMEFCHYSKLENFWRKYNNAFLEHTALKIHHQALKHENRQLQIAVKKYLLLLSENNGQQLLNTFVRGGRANTSRPFQKHITLLTGQETKFRRARPITCVEAATSSAARNVIN